MKSILYAINAGKMKALVLTLACTMIISMGTAALASGEQETIQETTVTTYTLESDDDVAFGVMEEDGVVMYSVDGGVTWSEETPDGMTVESSTTDFDFEDSLSVEVEEDGTIKYSIDGGETWTTELPDGYVVSIDENGSVKVSSGDAE